MRMPSHVRLRAVSPSCRRGPHRSLENLRVDRVAREHNARSPKEPLDEVLEGVEGWGILQVRVPGWPVGGLFEAAGGRSARCVRDGLTLAGARWQGRKATGGGALCAALRVGVVAIETHGLAPALGLRNEEASCRPGGRRRKRCERANLSAQAGLPHKRELRS